MWIKAVDLGGFNSFVVMSHSCGRIVAAFLSVVSVSLDVPHLLYIGLCDLLFLRHLSPHSSVRFASSFGNLNVPIDRWSRNSNQLCQLSQRQLLFLIAIIVLPELLRNIR